jgi:hypothetical protein
VPRSHHLDEYLERLPNGLRSFPEAQIRGEVLDDVLLWLDEMEAPIHPHLHDLIRAYRPLGRAMKWVPEVLENALFLQVVDEGYPSEESIVQAVYRRQRAVFNTTLYRALMLILSPTLLMMGASDRWKAFRRGSELSVDRWTNTPTGRITTATLRHPPGLYHRLHLLTIGEMMRAAIDACGAKDSKLELLEEQRPGETRFAMSYRA